MEMIGMLCFQLCPNDRVVINQIATGNTVQGKPVIIKQDEYPDFIYIGISLLKTMSRKIIAEAYLNPLKEKTL